MSFINTFLKVCLSVCLPIQHSISIQGKVTWSELATPIFYRPILIAVVMRFLQQMTGITPILVYLETIFSKFNVPLEPRLDIYSIYLYLLLDINSLFLVVFIVLLSIMSLIIHFNHAKFAEYLLFNDASVFICPQAMCKTQISRCLLC